MTKVIPSAAIEAGARALVATYYVNEKFARLEDFTEPQQRDFRKKAHAVLKAAATATYVIRRSAHGHIEAIERDGRPVLLLATTRKHEKTALGIVYILNRSTANYV